MIERAKLHAGQLDIPKKFKEALNLLDHSEVILELDTANKEIVIRVVKDHAEKKAAIMAKMHSLPDPLGGNPREDEKEYEFEDI